MKTLTQNAHYGKMIINKKAQFKIQQMTFMIAAIFIFFILAGLFVASIQIRNLRQTARTLEESKAVSIANFLIESPEFSCAGKTSCVDTDKLMVLKNKTAYKDFWPVAYIRVFKVYPETDKGVKCTVESYPNCSVYDVLDTGFASTSSSGSYAALCRHENEVKSVCELGKIIIGYKIKSRG